uniref:Thioredoxin domain-containing protein n=1 Tax=Eutreptiella gymnastica TaxID=73025 RepID=A0A6U7UPZ3_9EUGL
MDLTQQAILEEQLLRAAEIIEEQVDDKLKTIDEMDDDELERIRERRIQQMKKDQQKKDEYIMAGHGVYSEVTDPKDFFDQAKRSKRMVAHFYRPVTWRCEIVDKHLEILAMKHYETKFVKINAEKSPFLVERLNIFMMPSIVLIKDGKTEHTIQGFDDMGGHDDFPTEHLEAVLCHHKVCEVRD